MILYSENKTPGEPEFIPGMEPCCIGMVTRTIPTIVPIMTAASKNHTVYVTTLEAPLAYLASSSSCSLCSGLLPSFGLPFAVSDVDA